MTPKIPTDDTVASPAERELAGLLEELVQVRAENDQLARRIGPRAAAARSRPRPLPNLAEPDEGRPASAYRRADREALAARMLPEVHSALANERVDQAVLQSMLDTPSSPSSGAARWPGVVAALAVAAGLGLAAGNFGIFLFVLAVIGLFAGVNSLIKSIPPGGDAPPPPPALPPGGF